MGSGFAGCHALLDNVREAVEHLALVAEVSFVADLETVMAYGVMRMPAPVVNKQGGAMGKALETTEVEQLLQKLGRT